MFSPHLAKKMFFSFFLLSFLIYPAAAHSNLVLTVSGASDALSDSGLELRKGLNYFLPGDLFELTVENTGDKDGKVYVSIHLRSDSNSTMEEREWVERWFIYNNLAPIASPTLSAGFSPQLLSKLPQGNKITLLNFFVDENVSMDYPVIFVGYLFDDSGNIIGFDSRTVFFTPINLEQ